MTAAIPPPEDRRPGDRARGIDSLPSLAWRLVRHWGGQLLALSAACGVVAATIAGALGVGDSLQNGLRGLALERLGGITTAVVSDDLFRADMVRGSADAMLPAVVLEVTLEVPAAPGGEPRSARATLLACDDAGGLGFEPPAPVVGRDEVAINDVLAASLGVRQGDTLVLRITK